MPSFNKSKPSLPKRLRDLAKEKLNRNSKFIALRQLEQNEGKNLRAEELAMSPPGTAPILNPSVEAKLAADRQRLGNMVQDKPLPLLPGSRVSANEKVHITDTEPIVQQVINSNTLSNQNVNGELSMPLLESEQPYSQQDIIEGPAGLGISNGDRMANNSDEHEQEQHTPDLIRAHGINKHSQLRRVAHLIECSDGTEDCVAVLLNPNVVEKITQALRIQRKVHAAERSLTRNFDRTSRLKRDISTLEDELRRREGNEACTTGHESDIDHEKVSRVEADLGKTKNFLAETTSHRESLLVSIQQQSRELKSLQTKLNTLLDNAFTRANVLEPCATSRPDSPFEDVNNEIQIHTISQQQSKPPSAFTQQRRPSDYETAIAEAYETAKFDLHEAQHNFAHFDDLRQQPQPQTQPQLTSMNTSSASASVSALARDHHLLNLGRTLTRALITAEQSFHTARAAAQAAGVYFPDDDDEQSSAFGDADGWYTESVERAMVASVPAARVQEWMAGIPEGAWGGGDLEGRWEGFVDGLWEGAGVVEVGIGDSASARVEGRGRARIDGWREVCGW